MPGVPVGFVDHTDESAAQRDGLPEPGRAEASGSSCLITSSDGAACTRSEMRSLATSTAAHPMIVKREAAGTWEFQ